MSGQQKTDESECCVVALNKASILAGSHNPTNSPALLHYQHLDCFTCESRHHHQSGWLSVRRALRLPALDFRLNISKGLQLANVRQNVYTQNDLQRKLVFYPKTQRCEYVLSLISDIHLLLLLGDGVLLLIAHLSLLFIQQMAIFPLSFSEEWGEAGCCCCLSVVRIV